MCVFGRYIKIEMAECGGVKIRITLSKASKFHMVINLKVIKEWMIQLQLDKQPNVR